MWLEVVQILSNEGLDRNKGNQLTSEDIYRMMANSPPNFEPIDADFFLRFIGYLFFSICSCCVFSKTFTVCHL